MQAKTFILSDESINRYGFRLLSNGVDLNAFAKNAVMLFNHETEGDVYTGPIGRWENLRNENGQILADAIFDENDPFAKAIADKVANGFLNATSVGFRIIETSEDPSLMIAGQTRPTVTKWDMIEASIVDIPANKNALALYDNKGSRIELNDTTLDCVHLSFVTKNDSEMSKKTLLPSWDGIKEALGYKDKKGQSVEVELSDSDMDKLNQQIAERDVLKDQLSGKETEITSLKAKIQTIEASKTSVETELATAKADLATAKAALEGKGENPFAGNQGSENTDLLKYKTSFDDEKYGI